MDSASLARIAAQFEGLLLQQMLRPMTQSLGDAADLTLGPIAQSVASHDSHGFAALLTHALEGRTHDRT